LRAKALTSVLLISLGLGTGANAAVYSVIEALLFRAPEGISNARRLASIYTSQYDGSVFGPSSMPDYLSVVQSARSFESVAAFDDRTAGNARIAGHLQHARTGMVSRNFFNVLGITPFEGRLLEERDFQTPSSPAVISFGFWDAAGRPPIESLTVSIRGHEHPIVGILPRRFRGLDAGRTTDVWMPLQGELAARGRGDRHLSLIGRLRDRATFAQIDAELAALAERLATEAPATNRGMRGRPDSARLITARRYSPLQPEARMQASMIAAIVAGSVGMLLLSACLNGGTLLLARGFARRRELAVKMALGATRAQLARQLLAESLLIALAGAALGLLFADWTLKAIPALFSPDHVALLNTVLQPAAILITALIALAAGGLFGIAPALYGTSSPASIALRADAGGVSDEPGGRALRSTLVAAQIAVSTVLLLGSGLLVTSLHRVLDADPKFPAENVALAVIENPGRFEDPLRGIAFQRTLVETLRKNPGVHTVGWATNAPLAVATRDEFRIEAGAAGVTDTVELDVNVVSPAYFGAIGMNLLEGRLFDDGDRALSAPVVIVDELLARRFFGESAATQTLLDMDGERYEIVGVVRGRRFRALQETSRPTVYFPVAQRYIPQGNLFIVMPGDAAAILGELPQIISGIDGGAAVTRLKRLDAHLSESLVIDRLTTTLVAVCGGLALALAIIGVYGVMNDTVRRRTREIGLRVALGAARRQVARLVFSEAFSLSIIGLAAGTGLAIAGSRIAAAFLGGTPDWSLTTLGAPPLLLALIVVAAAILPLRKALSVSAAIALRAE
jgi:predicted permease